MVLVLRGSLVSNSLKKISGAHCQISLILSQPLHVPSLSVSRRHRPPEATEVRKDGEKQRKLGTRRAMATGLREDGRESSDGCRSRANKLAGAAFSLSMRCRTVVTSPPPTTHACSRVAAVDALFHGVVGRCRRRRVAPRACAAPLGLERRSVVRAWTTTRSRRVMRGHAGSSTPPPPEARLRATPLRCSATRHPGARLARHPLPGASPYLRCRAQSRCAASRATHHRDAFLLTAVRATPPPPLPELARSLAARDLRLRLRRPPPSSVPPWPVLVRRVRRERDWDRDRRGADRWGPPIF